MYFENSKSFIEESKFRFDKASGHFPTLLSEVEFGVKYDKLKEKNSDLRNDDKQQFAVFTVGV